MRPIRLWQRDDYVLSELDRGAYTTRQLCRLAPFPSPKKTAECMCRLRRAGLVASVAYYHPAKHGKPEGVHYTRNKPSLRNLLHTLGVSEARVQTSEWQRDAPDYVLDFYYPNELTTSSGLLPDGTLLVHRGQQTALVFFEIDRGTEPVNTPSGYSLAHKLSLYAAYFDSEAPTEDFRWAGTVRGFRVALVLPARRLGPLRQLISAQHYDFVILTTTEDFATGYYRHIWTTHDGTTVDILGRPTKKLVEEPQIGS